MRAVDPPKPEEIARARARIRGVALRTPLLPLDLPDLPVRLHLKLECLQPIGSFKIRGAMNAMRAADPKALERGVYTASAGNMAQGVAWGARALGIPCTAIVPEQAPRAKLDAIERLGATVVKVPFTTWWEVLETHGYPGIEGLFVHPVADPAVIAGNGTIGLEILEDLPDTEAILVPFGGGGLLSGIAIAAAAMRPATRVYACEVETAAPLTASLREGSPQTIDHRPSFVDGIGGRSVLPEMWPMVRGLVEGAIVVTLEEVARAIRLLIERVRVVAEGAGGASVAAALRGEAEGAKVVCVVSGGNIDPVKLAAILGGQIPG
ncbi:MAG TPA: pyridoxal-phosphate dependent enzyme [Candidatus Saccharimonadales bacterium]|nr:pyridoxal-phosphate dependent enzyme [Candidatus Saccharimonadales bacterium]